MSFVGLPEMPPIPLRREQKILKLRIKTSNENIGWAASNWGILYDVNGVYDILKVTIVPPGLLSNDKRVYRELKSLTEVYSVILDDISNEYRPETNWADNITMLIDTEDSCIVSVGDIMNSHPELFI